MAVVSRQASLYSGPCILRPPLQPRKYGLKLEVVLKWGDINTENIRVVSLISDNSLKIEGIVKRRGLKLQGPLYQCCTCISLEGIAIVCRTGSYKIECLLKLKPWYDFR